MVSTQNLDSGGATNGTPPNDMIAKLLSVESELVAQEAKLAAQLEAVRQKQQSLQTVIQMFAQPEGEPTPLTGVTVEADGSNSNGAASKHSSEAASAPLLQNESAQASPKSVPEQAALQSDSPVAALKSTVKPTPKPVKSSRRRKRATQRSVQKSKVTVAPWQFHVREIYQDISLPKAVRNVLQESPDDVVEISEIIAKIFVSDIPEEAQASARDRLSNVLSVGLKKEHWYRGKTGHYSISEAAAKASRA